MGKSQTEFLGVFTKPAEAIVAAQHVLPPLAVFQVPEHGLTDAAVEGLLRYPSQLSLDLGGIDRVSAVMARTIGHEGDQLFIRTEGRIPRPQLIEQLADGFDYFQIAFFVVAADVVRLTDYAARNHFEQRPSMIVHKQPVTDLRTVAIHRQRFAMNGVENYMGDQLFREMVWPVVVRAVGDNHRQTIGTVPGADQMIGTGLGCGVRRTGVVRRGLGEQIISPLQVAVHFIRGNMVETEALLPLRRQCRPIAPASFQHAVSADDIGLNKVRRAVDRAVHMGFRRQVHHCIWLEAGENLVQRRGVTDIHLLEFITRAVGHRCQGLSVAGIGELIDIADSHVGICD